MGWLTIIAGSLLILYTFMQDYAGLVIRFAKKTGFDNLAENPDFLKAVSDFIPPGYNWSLFVICESIILSGLVVVYRQSKKSEKNPE